ncbi:hypothetical protein [Nonomuraea gerenzanensis]|uniref:Uncharacterized protein n=1 Tax=Nonomuraea gerenzanensis TaxID=93944 RepID=A0A1M4EHQ6_9ACTN|nr:hypothetical protein [Nonomuraea gerenzanensis]UBU10124.1 hypothetical protein LCN96_38015 [Nonomuraea gerenzanensis]SBO98497.1 hypothetical protein BN4615_P8013 [Nonomuraea gerenzanensis]
MSETSDELPEAVGGVSGESDVVAERSGCDTPRSRRPVSADLPEEQDEPQPEEEDGEEGDEIRPDVGPTG